MIQKVLTKYTVLIHVLALCIVSLSCLFKVDNFLSVPLIWLAVIVWEMAIMLPSVRKGENLAMARGRVFQALSRSLGLYVGVAFVILLCVQWLNSGCELTYYADADIWKMSPPAVAWLPFSVGSHAAFARFAGVLAAVSGALIVRFVLGRSSKCLLLRILSLICGVLALVGSLGLLFGANPDMEMFSDRMNPGVGLFFFFWTILGMGIYADAMANDAKVTGAFIISIGVFGCFLGGVCFASLPTLVVGLILCVLMVFYMLSYLAMHMTKGARLLLLLCIAICFGGLFLALQLLPADNPVALKLGGAATLAADWSYHGSEVLTRGMAALRIGQEHIWAGVGAEGFQHYVGQTVEATDWSYVSRLPMYVFCDPAQVLCEHGVLGTVLVFACVVWLLAPIIWRMKFSYLNVGSYGDVSRVFLFRISPVALTGCIATLVCLIGCWTCSVFGNPAVLICWSCAVAALPSFLPDRKKDAVEL